MVVLVMVLFICFFRVRLLLGFVGYYLELAWSRPGLPLLSNLSGPFQHFRAAILDAWRDAVSAELCARKGFRGGPCLILMALCSSLTLTMFGREKRRCFVVSLLGVFGMDFFLGRYVVRKCLVGFGEGCDSDGHLFWDCTFPPLVEIHEHPEFHDLTEMDKTSWPRCLLWHSWLPLHSGINGGSPWAQTLAEGSGQLTEWQLPADFDVDGAALRVADDPDVWTDGSLVDDGGSGVSSAGAGCFTFRDRRLWNCWNWGHLDGVREKKTSRRMRCRHTFCTLCFMRCCGTCFTSCSLFF